MAVSLSEICGFFKVFFQNREIRSLETGTLFEVGAKVAENVIFCSQWNGLQYRYRYHVRVPILQNRYQCDWNSIFLQCVCESKYVKTICFTLPCSYTKHTLILEWPLVVFAASLFWGEVVVHSFLKRKQMYVLNAPKYTPTKACRFQLSHSIKKILLFL